MKKWLLTCFVLLYTFHLCAYAKDETQPLDQIAAIVNDDIITQAELKHAVSLVKAQLFQEKATIPQDVTLKKQVLKQLIDKKLQLQLAKQAGIETSDVELDHAVDRIAKENNLTRKELYQRLTLEGMSPADYLDEMRDQMTIRRVQQQEIVSHMHVTPAEVKSYMNSNLWQDKTSEEYHLEDLLVPFSDTPSPAEIAEAKKQAQMLMTKYTLNKSLSSFVKNELGERAKEVQTADLGWRKIEEMPSLFADQITHMQAKEINGPIYAPNGFHIIRLVAVRSSEPKRMELTQKQVENLLLQRKFEQGVKQWISKLRGTAFIVINA